MDLEDVLTKNNLTKLRNLNNQHVLQLIDNYARLCKPARVSVITDDPKDIAYIRQLALDTGEEVKLKLNGHTITTTAITTRVETEQ